MTKTRNNDFEFLTVSNYPEEHKVEKNSEKTSKVREPGGNGSTYPSHLVGRERRVQEFPFSLSGFQPLFSLKCF